jgi:hypothetical protein
MQLKPITPIIVLSLVVASLLVAGCFSTPSDTHQTPSASAATHDAFLENYMAGLKNVSYADKNYTYKAWDVTWINSTAVRLEETYLNKSTNTTANLVATYLIFPTTQDATNYVNAMNKTAYSLANTVYSTTGGGYQQITGHAPQTFKYYEWNEGNPFNISEYKQHGIQQFDNIVKTSTIKILTT